jgi:chromosomal replication initiator protein
MAMYMVRKIIGMSFPDIGKEFGKDHTTVLYNVRKVETNLKKGDTALQNAVRDISANVDGCL